MSTVVSAEIKLSFSAMGTTFDIIGSSSDLPLLSEMQTYAHSLESMWTRFDDSSDLMQLNIHAGNFVSVSAETSYLVAHMRRGYELTGGLFNAGVLPAMLQAHFTAPNSQFRPSPFVGEHMDSLWNNIDIHEHQISLPRGLAIDAGGIGKGLAADLIAEKAMSQGARGIVVNAGGEVSVRGESVLPRGWSVGVENPFTSGDLLTTAFVHQGGFATSTPSGWIQNGNSHLMDPRTGLSIDSNIAQATVLSSRAVDSEILAKMCLLLPVHESLAAIDKLGAAALIVDENLDLYPSTYWSDFE